MYEASKRSIGRNTKKSTLGVRAKSFIKDKKSNFDRGTKISQNNTNNTVYGILIFFDNKYTKLDIRRSTSKESVENKNIESSINSIINNKFKTSGF